MSQKFVMPLRGEPLRLKLPCVLPVPTSSVSTNINPRIASYHTQHSTQDAILEKKGMGIERADARTKFQHGACCNAFVFCEGAHSRFILEEKEIPIMKNIF